MNAIRIAVGMLALALSACTAAPVAEKTSAVPMQFPLRDFFSNPERAYFRLSADGKTLGFMQPVAIDGAKRRVEVQYRVKDDEGHGFRGEDNQFEFYAAMEKFFAQHLRP